MLIRLLPPPKTQAKQTLLPKIRLKQLSVTAIRFCIKQKNLILQSPASVILAFEKPVQIGDLIEVGVHSGTIKEMGIRASKIATADGSEIIIPNGDLLSQHLVNWTLSNNNRRVELIVGVAYGTEVEKVRKLLYQLISSRDDIMQEPKPMVLVHTFGEKAVNFRVLFWVDDLNKWLEQKSRVMGDVYDLFQREGIVIPTT